MAEWWENIFGSGEYRELERIPPERTGQQVDFVLAALDLRMGDRLLDVACGIGRHSKPFAAAGLRVIGLDYSPAYLARAVAGTGSFSARYVRGDMRRLPIRSGSQDAAVSLFTSFGYFAAPGEDQQVLDEIGRALRQGGRFFLDIGHHDGLIRRFQDRDWLEIPDGFLLEERAWDARRGRVETVWTYACGGTVKRFPVSIRFYTCPEIERMLAEAGMEMLEVWGDWNGGPLTMESWRLLALARKR